jgi:hypothetical protein
MPLIPLTESKAVFDESLVALMAHSVRGVVNRFRKHFIELDICVIADTINVIKLKAPSAGATSVLVTNFVRGTRGPVRGCERDRVYAKIYVHREANKHLARVCIAHEIYHLALELDSFIKGGRIEWPKTEVTNAIESSCNQFAWQLCKYHDLFNSDSSLVSEHIRFPDKVFEKPFKMNNTAWYLDWPSGIALDPNNPFHRLPPLPEKFKLQTQN